MKTGLVRRSTGSWYEVEDEDGKIISCRIVGKMRLSKLKLTNPIGVGDHILFEIEEGQETGIIRKVKPRTNYVIRQSPRKKHQLHLIASNIDQAMLVATIAHPKLKQGFIDRFLVMTEPYGIHGVLVFNKSDVYTKKDMMLYQEIKELYEKIGYTVLLVSALDESTLSELKDQLKGKLTLVCGQSGVGKSTLINKLQPELKLKTEGISDYTGKGQHTTTFSQMFDLSFGGRIIDTPGIKTLSFNHLEIMDVAHNFREFFEYSKECKYDNCMHINEPNCAVKKGLEEGDIHHWRYANYLQLIDEIEDQNYWERNKSY